MLAGCFLGSPPEINTCGEQGKESSYGWSKFSKPNRAHSLFVYDSELSKNGSYISKGLKKKKEYRIEVDLLWPAKPKTSMIQPFQKKFAYCWVRKGE